MTIIFSDGFETGNLSAWTTTSVSPPTVQNSVKFSGNYALQGDLSDAAAAEYARKDLGVYYKSGYYRTYFMLTAAPPAGQFISMFDNSLGPVIGNDPYWFMKVGTALWGVLDMQAVPPAGISSDFIFQVPLNTWMCIEVFCAVSATVGRYTVWFNGNQVYDISGVNNTRYSDAGIRYLRAGYTFASAPYAGFAYTDDIIFSDAYIGTERNDSLNSTPLETDVTSIAIDGSGARCRSLHRAILTAHA